MSNLEKNQYLLNGMFDANIVDKGDDPTEVLGKFKDITDIIKDNKDLEINGVEQNILYNLNIQLRYSVTINNVIKTFIYHMNDYCKSYNININHRKNKLFII
jgi:hypothetical protein